MKNPVPLMEKNYLCRVLADAWNEIREFVRIQKLLQVLLSLFVAIIHWWLWDSRTGLAMPNISEALISLALGYATLLILVFICKVLTAPARLDKKERDARERAESEVEKLHKEITAAQSDNTGLEIIFDEKDQAQGVGRIAVKNRSLTKSVTNVEVWVTKTTALLEKQTLPSRVQRKDLHGNFRADMLHSSCPELFDIFRWDQNSNVHLCIQTPHGSSFKLKDLPNSECDFYLDARAFELPTTYARFRLKWNGTEVECHRLAL
jgi:hypothetical protein